MKEVTCPVCEGSGLDESEESGCRKCGGYGVVLISSQDSRNKINKEDTCTTIDPLNQDNITREG